MVSTAIIKSSGRCIHVRKTWEMGDGSVWKDVDSGREYNQCNLEFVSEIVDHAGFIHKNLKQFSAEDLQRELNRRFYSKSMSFMFCKDCQHCFAGYTTKKHYKWFEKAICCRAKPNPEEGSMCNYPTTLESPACELFEPINESL